MILQRVKTFEKIYYTGELFFFCLGYKRHSCTKLPPESKYDVDFDICDLGLRYVTPFYFILGIIQNA